MRKLSITANIFATCLLVLAAASAANAQTSTRTWVSGVGNDANNCTRTAPCLTFSGALAKTITGGQISVLDPGGFGTVSILKAITIDGTTVAGGMLASSVNGIFVNAGSNSPFVVIRHLYINGANSAGGKHGIQYSSGKSLVVEDCKISNFTGAGIAVANVAESFTSVRNTTISNCILAGVSIASSGGIARAALEDVHVFGSTDGFIATGSSFFSIITARECSATACGNSGFRADGTAATLNMRNCMSSSNVHGVQSSNGAIVRLSNNVLSDNITSGVSQTGSPLGIVETFSNNENQNVSPGTASPVMPS